MLYFDILLISKYNPFMNKKEFKTLLEEIYFNHNSPNPMSLNTFLRLDYWEEMETNQKRFIKRLDLNYQSLEDILFKAKQEKLI